MAKRTSGLKKSAKSTAGGAKSARSKTSAARAPRAKSRAAGRTSRPRAGASRAGGAASDVRTRIEAFTRRALRSGGASLSEFPRFSKKILGDAVKAVDESVPSSRANVLRQVVDALAEAGAATAHSVKATFTATAERGASFVRKDVKRSVQDLRELEAGFILALDHARKSLTGAAKDEMTEIVSRAKRAGTKIGPAAQDALKAADGRVIELGAETAKAGVRVSRRAVGGLLDSASGFLSALGSAARGK